MNSWVSKGIVVATAIVLQALTSAARAGESDDLGCSNATVKGAYAFGVTAYTPPGTNGPPQVITGIAVFDGKGKFTQRDYAGDSVPAEFSPPGQETGTYKVNHDCTGSSVLNLNIPVPIGSTGVIKTLFVLSDGGRHIHGVVSEFTPPTFTSPVPTQTSFDHWRVASEERDD
jgi:hypothetical protein